ncbi:MAG: sulfotransferase [Bacteroidota bacterium]|nr:sulfotransferase [Bacteroidota bacterium]
MSIKFHALNPLLKKVGKKISNKRFTNSPIIIGACPRSGTTLLLSILDSYPSIHAIQRQTYAFCSWGNSLNTKYKFTPNRIDRLYREFVFHKISKKSNRWCEKTPRNIKYFDKILDYYNEDAKLIHLIRDGRDIVTSKHPAHNPNEYWVSIDNWVKDVKFGLKYANRPNVLTVKYENLINNFDTEIKKISEFLNESYVPSQEEWINKTSLTKSKHWNNPVQNIHARAIGRWKKEKHKNRINEFMKNPEAKKLLEELGYI